MESKKPYSLRVIAGSAKNRKLLVADGITRPLTDRIKTSIFDLINPLIYGKTVLDLYSGSGAFAIEALSRGAKHADLVENNPQAISIIETNLKNSGVKNRANITATSVEEYLTKDQQQFNLIFMDPPFALDHHSLFSNLKAASKLLAEDGVLVIRAIKDYVFNQEIADLTLVYQKVYGESKVAFYRK